MCVESDEAISIVGDECHVVSQEQGGPRHGTEIPGGEVDGHGNLLLLCKVHHKCVDDHPDKFPVARLVEIKATHERWVESSLAGKDAPATEQFLKRVLNGRDLFDVLVGSHAYDQDHDELNTEEEVELVAGFMQNTQDWGEIGDLDSGTRVRAAFSLKQGIEELDHHGFWVFGGNRTANYELPDRKGHGNVIAMRVAVVRVLRKGSPEIVVLP